MTYWPVVRGEGEMHNFNRSKTSVDSNFEAAKKGLRKTAKVPGKKGAPPKVVAAPKRELMRKEEAQLKNSHCEYDKKAADGTLNTLSSIYPPNDSRYALAHDIYGSGRAFVTAHWEALKTENGGRALVCPICGLENCSEMDHFAPRALFPEHSFHLTNLIPLCHNCNFHKHDDWTDDAGHQIFFNAFFDTDLPASIIDCAIKVEGGIPVAEVSVSSSLNPANPQHWRIEETISRLGLLAKFGSRMNDQLRNVVDQIVAEYKVNGNRYKGIGEFYKSRIQVFREYLAGLKNQDFIEKALYTELLKSNTFKKAVKGMLRSHPVVH